MANGKKVKQNSRTVKLCNNCYSPIYLKFNLSYFNPCKEFYENSADVAQLFRRMHELSKENYVLMINRPKSTAFEFENVDIGCQIPTGFSKRFDVTKYSKFTIMRLYPNNNPIMARIVGITINKIFYMFYIFYGETGYKR